MFRDASDMMLCALTLRIASGPRSSIFPNFKFMQDPLPVSQTSTFGDLVHNNRSQHHHT